MPFAVVVV